MHFRRYALLYICLPLIVFAIAASHHRFSIAKDYIVEYEGVCEPETESCFIGCEDDECTEPYYYSIVQKQADDLFAQCGPDISECEAAHSCTESDTDCSVAHCDADLVADDETCEDIQEVAQEIEDLDEEPVEAESEKTL